MSDDISGQDYMPEHALLPKKPHLRKVAKPFRLVLFLHSPLSMPHLLILPSGLPSAASWLAATGLQPDPGSGTNMPTFLW